MGLSQGAPWQLRDTPAIQTALTERREKVSTEWSPYGKEGYRDAARQRKEIERQRQRQRQ